MFVRLVLVLLLPFCLAKSTPVTFKNVTFRGYSLYTEKFKKTIPLSNSLKDSLPESVFDKIEFLDQNVPVLYENSLADLDELDELVLENCGIYDVQPGALKNVPMLRRLSLKGRELFLFKFFLMFDHSHKDDSITPLSFIDIKIFNPINNLITTFISVTIISILVCRKQDRRDQGRRVQPLGSFHDRPKPQFDHQNPQQRFRPHAQPFKHKPGRQRYRQMEQELVQEHPPADESLHAEQLNRQVTKSSLQKFGR